MIPKLEPPRCRDADDRPAAHGGATFQTGQYTPHEAMLGSILPPDVVVAEATGDIAQTALFPDEAAQIRHAVETRQREFAIGRTLARRALRRLGWPTSPILSGPDREPTWPLGVTGSITHCDGYCAAAVARSEVLTTIGIDAEIHAPLPPDVLRLIGRDEECAWIHNRSPRDVFWDRLLFSAKESVFKAWFPVARRWLDFRAAEVRFEPETARFHARFVGERLSVEGRDIEGFGGTYVIHGNHILSAVVLPGNRLRD